MLKGTGTTPGAIRSEDAAIAAKHGVTPARIVAELVNIACPDSTIAHLIGAEDRAAAMAMLARIKPSVLAACGIQVTKVEANQ